MARTEPPAPPDQANLPAIGGRTNLRDETVRTLHAAIASGDLRPGVLYSAPSLARQLGVSATPVREAMLDLVNEGLVEAVRNKGFRVVELSERELHELTELRLLIEVPTVRRIAETGIPVPAMWALRALAADVEAAARRGDHVIHNQADMQFHASLLAEAGNLNLVRTVTALRIRSRLRGAAELAERGELEATLREHTELLDLIATGDASGAEALITRHIGHVGGFRPAARGTASGSSA